MGKYLLGLLVAGIAMVALAYSGIFDSPPVSPPPQPPAVVVEQPTPKITPRIAPESTSVTAAFSQPSVPISTGLMIPPSLPGLAPLSVKVSEDKNYYIKLSAPNGGDITAMFVEAGKSFEMDVPLGTYELKYAVGKTWYGPKHYFGPDTVYKKVDKLLAFQNIGNNKYKGHEVRLFLVVDGNLKPTEISADEF